MFFRKIKNLVKSSDLFYSSEMLRYQNELEYKSLTGGLISIALIITVLIGFANMIILTMQRQDISSTKEVTKNSDPPFMAVEVSPENKFMMGIQVYGVNLSSPARYFDYRFEESISVGGQTVSLKKIPLVQCTRQHWSQLPQVANNFENLRISNWLCPQIGFTLKVQGKYSSPVSSQYIFTLKQCVNSSNVTCASPQEISQLFTDNSNRFYLTFFHTNSIINENNKDFISYYLQDSHYAFFGDKIGSQSYIYLTDYTVQTDYSIWPFEDIEQVTGSYIQSLLISRPTQISHQGAFSGEYAYVRIDKSVSSVKYQREVQKISTVLSFIGGMIGALSALLFIIKAYNSQAFEIEIASALFTDSPENCQLKKNNFFSYLIFNIQRFFKSIGCCSKNHNYTVLQSCLQEMQKQLDVKSLIQRVIFLEHCLTFLFEDYQLSSIQLKRPTSYSAIKKVRQRCFQYQQGLSEKSSIAQNLKEVVPGAEETHITDIKMITENQPRTRHKQMVSIQYYRDSMISDDTSSVAPQKIKSRVENNYAVIEKKKKTLKILKENAIKGNIVSSKIYNHLCENKSEVDDIFKQ